MKISGTGRTLFFIYSFIFHINAHSLCPLVTCLCSVVAKIEQWDIKG